MLDNKGEIKARWERFAEFGNPLEQYRAVHFADITKNTEPIASFESDFMLKTLDHITVLDGGKRVVAFMDGTVMGCGGE